MKYKGKPQETTKQKPQSKNNFLMWYEIPTSNLERAIDFYSEIFDIKFEIVHNGTHTMAIFPSEFNIGGALVFGDGCIPSQTGSLLYLNVGADLDEALAKINVAGGQILMGKTLIMEDEGYYALILDSEGNRLALYSKV